MQRLVAKDSSIGELVIHLDDLCMVPRGGSPSALEIENVITQINTLYPEQLTQEDLECIVVGSTVRASVFLWKMLSYANKISHKPHESEEEVLYQKISSITELARPELWLKPWQKIEDGSQGSVSVAMLMLSTLSLLPPRAEVFNIYNQLDTIFTPEFIVYWHSRLLQFTESIEPLSDKYFSRVNESQIIIGLANQLVGQSNNVVLIKLFTVLRERISMRALLADMKIYQYEGGNVFRLLIHSWQNNPHNSNLFENIRYFVNQIPAEALGQQLITGEPLGDSPLYLLCFALTRNLNVDTQQLLKIVIEKARPEFFGAVIKSGSQIGRTPLLMLTEQYVVSENGATLFALVKTAIDKAPFEFFVKDQYLEVSTVLNLIAQDLGKPTISYAIELSESLCKKEGAYFKRESTFLLALLDAWTNDLMNKKLAYLVNFVAEHSDREIWVNKTNDKTRTPINSLRELFLNHSTNVLSTELFYKVIHKFGYGEAVLKVTPLWDNYQQELQIFSLVIPRSVVLAQKMIEVYRIGQRKIMFLQLLADLERKQVTTAIDNQLMMFIADAIPSKDWDTRAETSFQKIVATSRHARSKQAAQTPDISIILHVIDALDNSLKRDNPAWSKILMSLLTNVKERSKVEKTATIWEPKFGDDEKNPVLELIRLSLTRQGDATWVKFICELISFVPKESLEGAPVLWEKLPNTAALKKIIDVYQNRIPKVKPKAEVLHLSKKNKKTGVLQKAPEIERQEHVCAGKHAALAVQGPLVASDSTLVRAHVPVDCSSDLAISGISPNNAISSVSTSCNDVIYAELNAIFSKIRAEPENLEYILLLSSKVSAEEISLEVWLGVGISSSDTTTPPLANLIDLLNIESTTPNFALYQLIRQVIQVIPANKWDMTWVSIHHNERTFFSFLLEVLVYRNTIDAELLNLLEGAVLHCAAERGVWARGLLYKDCMIDHPLRMLTVILYRTRFLPLFDVLQRIHEKIPAEMWNIGGVREWKERTPLNILRQIQNEHDCIRALLHSVQQHLMTDRRVCNTPSLTAKGQKWSPTMYRTVASSLPLAKPDANNEQVAQSNYVT